MEKKMHRLEQYSRRECIEISAISSSITNDLLEEHVLLIFEKLEKLRNIALYNHDESENSNSRNIFINQSFCLYYRKLYGLVKDLSNEGLIDSFWIRNGTIKIRESSQSKPVSITHESDLQF